MKSTILILMVDDYSLYKNKQMYHRFSPFNYWRIHSNNCTKLFEKEKAVLVYLSENTLRSPKNVYPYRQPEKDWWDVKKVLFVIQSISYKGNFITLIEGTNIDATIAGIYYFENTLYLKRKRIQNANILLGMARKR